MIVDHVILQFSTEPHLHRAIIRWFTNSKFSHVDFVLPDGCLMGARYTGGIQIRQPNYTKFTLRERFAVRTRQADSVYAWAKTQIGVPYDWQAILDFMLDRAPTDNGKFFCSNYVAVSFKNGGYPILNAQANAKSITPNDLYLSPFMEQVGIDAVPRPV